MNNWLSRIPGFYWIGLIFMAWAALVFLVLQKGPYGIDEGAARALLLVWSVADHVVNPVVVFSVPDFRALFFAPVGMLWTGNLLAAKIIAIIFMFAAGCGIYLWRRDDGDAEGALLATGILLISPLAIEQIDTLSVTPYLLAVFVSGAWLDKTYRAKPQTFGGVYFLQMALCFVAAALHPIGLGYPLLLAWSWHKNAVNKKQRFHYMGGIAFAVLFALLMTLGWRNAVWFDNPMVSLSALILPSLNGNDLDDYIYWVIGGIFMLLLFLLIWRERANLWRDFLGRLLTIALGIGLLTDDTVWATIALTIILYWGYPVLLRVHITAVTGFWGQRGIPFAVLLVISNIYLWENKLRYQQLSDNILNGQDQLIRNFSENPDILGKEENTAKKLRVASQWPARTMLACRCDSLPLPPPAKDGPSLLAMLPGVDYLLFDPQDIDNHSLAGNLALLGGEKSQVMAVMQGGVIVHMKSPGN